jgi:hypothetical protein
MNIEFIVGLVISSALVLGLGWWIYKDNHERTHLFVVHCPLCRKDPYRMALMADMYGMEREREILLDAAAGQQPEQEDTTDETKDEDE